MAAGSGTRMGNSVPKQFLALSGKPVLLYSVEAFLLADPDFRIILVVPAAYLDKTRSIVAEAGFAAQTTVISGGLTRPDSVSASLGLVDDEAIVLVHDAARCAVSKELIRRCYEQALALGSAIPVIPVTDSVRKLTGHLSEPLDRQNLRLVQTPQAFRAKLLKNAYTLRSGKDFTDDASVLEHAGIPVHLIEGETTNIKITLPVDLEIAALLRKR